jgi:hypothetical protein
LGDGYCDPAVNPNFGIVQLQYYSLPNWNWANLPRFYNNNVTLCVPADEANYLTTFNSTSFGPQSTYFAFGQINSTEDLFMQNLISEGTTASVTIST